MSYASLDDLRSQLGARPRTADEQQRYTEKMLHQIPQAPVVKREEFILDHCKGKRVLEFGASGKLQRQIMDIAGDYLGVDRTAGISIVECDLDDVSKTTLPMFDAEVIVCGEVLEHLSNPGWFLTRLRRQYAGVTMILTVPNAFGSAAAKHMATGVENINRDHVAWYSFHTLKTLLGRAGYTQLWFGWYRGEPLTAEGLIMVVH